MQSKPSECYSCDKYAVKQSSDALVEVCLLGKPTGTRCDEYDYEPGSDEVVLLEIED